MRRGLAGLRGSPEVLPGLFAVGVLVALAASEGGFEPTSWYPATVFFLGLLAIVGLAFGRRGRLASDLAPRLAIGLLAAFTAWAFFSITWSGVQADAWDGANRTLLYLLVFALFALLPWRAPTAALVLAGHTVGIAVLALITVGDLAGAADPELGLVAERLSKPTGYHNATAALFLAAFFPALLLASRREVPWWGRAPLLAAAGVLLEVAIVPQSRGSLIAFPLVAIAFVAVAPGRARLLLVGAPVALAVFLASEPLLDVYSVVRDGGEAGAAFDDAYGAITLSAVALLAYGLLLGIAERLIEPPERIRRYAGRTVGAVAALAAVAGLVVALNATGNPASWIDERWQDFKSGEDTSYEQDSRFAGSLGTNRYDFWRVAMDEWADDPVVGLGMDQFAVDYVRERRSDEEPFNPHSIGVKVVSQTGLVGTVLFVGFLVVAVAAALRTRVRAGNSLEGAVAAAGLIAFTYWLTHGFGDWLWEFPGLTAPALAWLALGATLGARPQPRATRPRVAVAGSLIAGLLALGALGSLVPPWGAARDVGIAARNWPANPDGAFERLDRARDLNPLSDEADVVAGTIAIRAGRPELARAAFARALERNDESWYSLLALGTLEAAAGERAAARGRFEQARELTPRDPLVRDALRRLVAGEPLRSDAIDNRLRMRICPRVGRTEATPHC